MADGTHISWTDATWNPITGCSVLSPGCKECYAMRLAGTRLRDHPSRTGLTTMTKAGPVWNGVVRFNEQWLDQPLRWRDPRMIFVVAHGDLFHENVPDEWIDPVMWTMAYCPRHTFQVLTKRLERMASYIRNFSPERMASDLRDRWPFRHILLGGSIEDQRRADERRPHLAALAAAGWRTWVSYEPSLGPIDWRGWEFVKWIVSGGESGPRARPSHPDWHRATRDFCAANGIAYHFKQWGNWAPFYADAKGELPWAPANYRGMMNCGKKVAGATLDGREWREFPK